MHFGPLRLAGVIRVFTARARPIGSRPVVATHGIPKSETSTLAAAPQQKGKSKSDVRYVDSQGEIGGRDLLFDGTRHSARLLEKAWPTRKASGLGLQRSEPVVCYLSNHSGTPNHTIWQVEKPERWDSGDRGIRS